MTTPQNEAKSYKELLAALEPRQRKFVQAYVREPNATKAAIKAGYSEKTARQMGSENLSKPAIAAAVEAGFEQVMGKHEVRSRTAEVASGTFEDFLTIERVPYSEPVLMDAEDAADLIDDTIADLSEELDSAKEERAAWIAGELKRLRRLQRRCTRAIERADQKRERSDESGGDGPAKDQDPEVWVDVVWKERVVVRVDLEKAREAGKLHLIKKFKEGKYGTELELYDAAAARELLGKHYRLWGDRLALENPDGTPIKFVVGIPESAL